MKTLKVTTIILTAVLLAGCGAAKEPEQAESLTQEQQDSIAADVESQMDAMLEDLIGGSGVELPEIPVGDSEMTDPMDTIPGELGDMHDAMLGDFTGDMDLAGSWQDEVGQRASMEVTENEDGSYAITITWSSSADETATWEISGTWDPEFGGLTYEDGAYYVTKTGFERSEEETTEGALMKEGEKVRWTDSKIENDAVFVKS